MPMGLINPVINAVNAFLVIMQELPTSIYHLLQLACGAFVISKIFVIVWHVNK